MNIQDFNSSQQKSSQQSGSQDKKFYDYEFDDNDDLNQNVDVDPQDLEFEDFDAPSGQKGAGLTKLSSAGTSDKKSSSKVNFLKNLSESKKKEGGEELDFILNNDDDLFNM